jgi:hypothetical protein
MTIQVDGVDLIAAAEVAALVGGIVSMLVIGLLVYLLVRPPRHVRQAKQRSAALHEGEAEEMIRLMDRMEERLEVLERALADPTVRRPHSNEQRILEPAEGRENRRIK